MISHPDDIRANIARFKESLPPNLDELEAKSLLPGTDFATRLQIKAWRSRLNRLYRDLEESERFISRAGGAPFIP
jgi:hypothetical protein